MGAQPNAKDSMKSTWRSDKSQWGPDHRLLNFIQPSALEFQKKIPVFKKSESAPVLTVWSCDLYVLIFAAWPMMLQGLYYWVFGENIPPVAAFFLYLVAFKLNAVNEIDIIDQLSLKFGFLDGDEHPRDDIPDVGVTKAVLSVLWTTGVRPFFTLIFTYDQTSLPLPSVWLPVELVLYSIILDLFFYAYHRSCHEVDFLWRYHRTHHLTKHPNPFLSAYADFEQEILEIAVIPIATFTVLRACGFPMTFYDWWICHQFIIFAEIIGHSGLRMLISPPGLSTHLLKPIDCALIVEDHDMHHRKGYRKSYNYGKQTLLWDTIFGTRGPRVELRAENIDHSRKIRFPLLP